MKAAMFDETTSRYFLTHHVVETTLCRCESCGLFYKPILGHECGGVKDNDYCVKRKK